MVQLKGHIWPAIPECRTSRSRPLPEWFQTACDGTAKCNFNNESTCPHVGIQFSFPPPEKKTDTNIPFHSNSVLRRVKTSHVNLEVVLLPPSGAAVKTGENPMKNSASFRVSFFFACLSLTRPVRYWKVLSMCNGVKEMEFSSGKGSKTMKSFPCVRKKEVSTSFSSQPGKRWTLECFFPRRKKERKNPIVVFAEMCHFRGVLLPGLFWISRSLTFEGWFD